MQEAPKLEKVSETLFVYQQKGVFFYGTDAVLLSAYASSAVKPNSKSCGIELCSGTAFAALSLLDRFPHLEMSALEINKDACRLSEMSAEKSGLADRFKVKNGDVCNVKKEFPSERFDFVICNPPYMTATSGKMCADDYKTVARHEILCNMNDIFKASYYLLGTGGSLFIVYRPDRLSSLFSGAKENGFEIKKMTFVFSKTDREPVLVLCEAKKQAKEGLRMTPPFVIYGKDGHYTEMMKQVSEKGVISFGK
jgi:tRNA1Val (adenine37-N6)-methyltransferase